MSTFVRDSHTGKGARIRLHLCEKFTAQTDKPAHKCGRVPAKHGEGSEGSAHLFFVVTAPNCSPVAGEIGGVDRVAFSAIVGSRLSRRGESSPAAAAVAVGLPATVKPSLQ